VSGATYTHGHHDSVVSQHARRTAEECAAFLLPYLRSGMRLLDCGCGPGSITLGLARAVAPGQVVAIDVVADVLERARGLAREAGVTNVTFQAANIYEPPFDDQTFDSVYAHQVLQHLADPLGALRQARRLLRPGGIVAVRDSDYGAMTFTPTDPRLDRFLALYREVARRNGGEPDAGRYLKGWLLDAGFADLEITTATWTFTDAAGIRDWGDSWALRVTESALAERALHYGIATRADLDDIAAAWREWGRSPRAFGMVPHTAGLGWRREP
jgi:ubiquinone/menaquinone biosynthesis C-methylase UbiE